MGTSRWSEPCATWEESTCGTADDDGSAATATDDEGIGGVGMDHNPSDTFR